MALRGVHQLLVTRDGVLCGVVSERDLFSLQHVSLRTISAAIRQATGIEALQAAHVIAAEDTRRLRKLVSMLELEIHANVVSYFDQNEDERTPWMLQQLEAI